MKLEDLERIGLGRPAARRLLDAVKKKKYALWRKNIMAKILPAAVGTTSNKSPKPPTDENSFLSPTCLILKKVSFKMIYSFNIKFLTYYYHARIQSSLICCYLFCYIPCLWFLLINL